MVGDASDYRSEGLVWRDWVGGIGSEGSGRRDPDRGFYKKISKSTNNLELFTWFFQALLYTNISGFSLVRPNELFRPLHSVVERSDCIASASVSVVHAGIHAGFRGHLV